MTIDYTNKESSHQLQSASNSKIQIRKEYENLLPPMSNEVFESLVSSIRESGQQELITINEKGELLDGKRLVFKVRNLLTY